MLRSLKELVGYAMSAADGDIGRIVSSRPATKHWADRVSGTANPSMALYL